MDMEIVDYESLKANIKDWSKRGQDTDAQLDNFIKFAEKQINRKLRLHDNDKRSIAIFKTADRFIKLPDQYIEMRSFRISADRLNWHDLQYAPPKAMARHPISNKGMPAFYTTYRQIEFDRTPEREYFLEMIYFRGLIPLKWQYDELVTANKSTEGITNIVLDRYPDLYLYGALTALHHWARDEEAANYYRALFADTIEDSNEQELRGRYGPAPVQIYTGCIP